MCAETVSTVHSPGRHSICVVQSFSVLTVPKNTIIHDIVAQYSNASAKIQNSSPKFRGPLFRQIFGNVCMLSVEK